MCVSEMFSEPDLGIATIIVVNAFPTILPHVMAFAGGAMTFLVIEDTIPGMITKRHSDKMEIMR